LLGREEGLQMVAVYGKARRTHRWFAVVPDSPLRTLADLKSKRLSCDFQHLAALGEAALSEEGVPIGSYQWVPWRGSGMATQGMIEPLRRGDVDAVFLIDWNDGDFIAEGLRMRRLPSKALDRIRLSSCMWVSNAYLESHREAIIGVGRAIAKTTTFALANPEAAVRLMWREAAETRPSALDQDRIFHRDIEIMKPRLESFRIDPADRDPRWGAIDDREIVAWQDFLLGSGAIKRRLDPKLFYTDDFVDGFNTFDAHAVEEQARAFRS
jgi:NitT/TauT family transport system substrate-binding protein